MTRAVCFVTAGGRRSDFFCNDFHDEKAKERDRERCVFLFLSSGFASELSINFGFAFRPIKREVTMEDNGTGWTGFS
jgi:hypothetical protein